jgi:hypothetical protein
MSRKPTPAQPAPHPLPSGGGCYELQAGELVQTEAPAIKPGRGTDAADEPPLTEA